MKWIEKYDTAFLWIFSYKGLVSIIIAAGFFYVLIFHIIRYKTIACIEDEDDCFYLSVDMNRSRCVLCKENEVNDVGYYYTLSKDSDLIFRFRIGCIGELYRHPYILSYSKDSIILANRTFSHLVLLKIPVNRSRIFLKDVKFDFIDKSGFPKDTSSVNYDLRRLPDCYNDY